VPFEVMRGYWSKIVCVTDSRIDFTTAVLDLMIYSERAGRSGGECI
jgi:hypothetical protein